MQQTIDSTGDKPRHHAPRRCRSGIAVAALAGFCASASAGVTFSGGGDIDSGPPFYQSLAYAGFKSETGGGFKIEEGNIYWSNVATSPGVTIGGAPGQSVTLSKNGADMTAYASTYAQGFFSARNYAGIEVRNAQAADGYYAVGGSGSFTTVQFFAPVEVASTRFHWRVTGTEFGSVAGGCQGNPLPFCATGRLDFMASTNQDDRFNDLYTPNNGHLVAFGPGEYVYDFSGIPLGQVINLFYWTSAFTQVMPGTFADDSDFELIANYANTFDMFEIEAFDPAGNLIPQWSLKDFNSGAMVFDQDGRIDAAVAGVPEPATLALLAVGLMGTVGSRIRPCVRARTRPRVRRG